MSLIARHSPGPRRGASPQCHMMRLRPIGLLLAAAIALSCMVSCGGGDDGFIGPHNCTALGQWGRPLGPTPQAPLVPAQIP